MSNKRSSGSKRLYGGPQQMQRDKFSNIPPDTMESAKCHDLEALISTLGSTTFIEDYGKSIEYINSCHNIINKLIAKSGMPVFTMPDMPNFLQIFTTLYKMNEVHKQGYDNLETLEEIYSRIGTLGSKSFEEELDKLSCITNSDTETERVEPVSTDDDDMRRPKNELSNRPRASSIPRRVTKRMHQQPQSIIQHNEGVQSLESKIQNKRHKDYKVRLVSSTETLQSVNSVNNKKVRHRNPSRIDMENLNIPQKQLEICAKELLKSYGETFSTSTETSPKVSPRGKISTMEVPNDLKNEHGLQSSTLKCNNQISIKCNIDRNNKLNDVLLENPIKVGSTYKKNTNLNSASVLNNSTAPRNDKSRVSLQPVTKTIRPGNKSVCKIIDYASSEIDSDENRSNQNSANTKKAPRARKKISQLNNVPKKLPSNVVFQKRLSKISVSDSEVDSDRCNKLKPESDVENDQFCKKYPTKKASMPTLRPSTSVSLPQDVLLDIGILMEDGQIKPDMMEELEKLKTDRSTDKQNLLFRQPRNRKVDNSDILKIMDIADVTEEIYSGDDQEQRHFSTAQNFNKR